MLTYGGLCASLEAEVVGRPAAHYFASNALCASAFLVALLLALAPAGAEPVRLVALGDSLTAGLGLEPKDAFPAKLEAALRARGFDVAVENAGVSGDTTQSCPAAARLGD